MNQEIVAIEAPIVGAWRLVTFQSRQDNGAVTYPFGEEAQGTLIYTARGRYAVQLMRATRPRFADPDQMKGTPAEIKASFEGCIAYFGSAILEYIALLSRHVSAKQGRFAICNLSKIGCEIASAAERGLRDRLAPTFPVGSTISRR